MICKENPITAFVAIILFCCDMPAQEKPLAEMTAIVCSISGEATATAPSSPRRSVLAPFDWLATGSVLRVGRNSHLVVAFANGRRFQMQAGSTATLAGDSLKASTGSVEELTAFPPMPRLAAIDPAARPGTRSGAVRIRGDRAQISNLYPRSDTPALPDQTALLFSPARENAHYRVELEDESGRTVFAAETESASLVVPTGILKPGARYYWRVRTVELLGPAARGESEFMTLPAEQIARRASFRASLGQSDTGGLALLAEIDLRLGLLLEARNGFRDALAKAPSDTTLRGKLDAVERRLYPEKQEEAP